MAWGEGHGRTSTPQWRALRTQVLTRDKHTCPCGLEANEVDHIVPWSLGGTDTLDNLVAMCSGCHSRKSAQEGVNARIARRKALKRSPKRHPGAFE